MKVFKLIGSILLFLLATVLVVLVGVVAFIYGLFTLGKIENYSRYFKNLAVSIDQFGNAITAPLFNHILITPEGYQFGNIDETISSVLGKNKKQGTLSKLGLWIDKILEFIESGHSTNSIELNP